MLNGARMPTRFWGEGLNYLRHVIVGSSSSSIPRAGHPTRWCTSASPTTRPCACSAVAPGRTSSAKSARVSRTTPSRASSSADPTTSRAGSCGTPSANGGRGGIIVSRDIVWNEDEFPGLSRVAHYVIPERFGRTAEAGDAERSPDEEDVSNSTNWEGVAIPLPFEPAVPPSDSDSSSSSSRLSRHSVPDPLTPAYSTAPCARAGTAPYVAPGRCAWSTIRSDAHRALVSAAQEEAEFVSAVSAGQEIVWMRSFLGELGYYFDVPSLLLVDNQSAIQVVRNPEHHGRMKHLDLRFFWLSDMVNSGVIAVRYIPTADMAADLPTKTLARVKVASALPQLGLTAP
jgi:hypothetical protein